MRMSYTMADIERFLIDYRQSQSLRLKSWVAGVPVVGKEIYERFFLEESKRNKWLTENYEAYSLALMIATAVFDAMPYMWVVREAEVLYDSFENKNGKEEKRYGITEILSQFGAVICKGELNTYTGITPIDIVRLEQKTLQKTKKIISQITIPIKISMVICFSTRKE